MISLTYRLFAALVTNRKQETKEDNEGLKTNFELVKEFNEAYGVYTGEPLTVPPFEITALRVRLITEEYNEVLEAPDIYELAKELADLLYVVYGTGLSYGIDLDKCFREIHRSNMSKLGADGKPILREDGKVLKGPNYSKADVKKALNEDTVL